MCSRSAGGGGGGHALGIRRQRAVVATKTVALLGSYSMSATAELDPPLLMLRRVAFFNI